MKSRETFSADSSGFCDIVTSLCLGEILYQVTMTFILPKNKLEVRNVHQARIASLWYGMVYLLTAIGLTPVGSSTVHIYTPTIHRKTQWNRISRTEHT